MIFVSLGTQDKSFKRLLKAIDKCTDEGTIKEKVVVQAGYTKYKSKNMQIFSYLNSEQFENYVKKANVIICHAGVGTILTALRYDKPIISAARLAKYKEHNNDHQLEILHQFTKYGFIVPLEDFNALPEVYKTAKKFIPKKYVSNDVLLMKEVTNYIDTHKRTYINPFIVLLSIVAILVVLILTGVI